MLNNNNKHTIPGLGEPDWLENSFTEFELIGEQGFKLACDEFTERFYCPDRSQDVRTSPVVWFKTPNEDFSFDVSVDPELKCRFDAAGLLYYASESWWAKCVCEQSPLGHAELVTLVSRPVSDDAIGPEVTDVPVRIRLTRKSKTLALHWWGPDKNWRLIRYVELPEIHGAMIGLTVQSPEGKGCRATFDQASLSKEVMDVILAGR